ncbi:MAG TPA: hypothetical protein VEJ67_07655 [Candidatus Cybelea sp.]|nr:hypothetical protein [Candidatus Cybelea sp.]
MQSDAQPELNGRGAVRPHAREIAGRSQAVRNHLLIFGLYALLGVVFTLPGSLSPRSALLGYPGDNFQHAWFLWHFARAITRGHNPFYTRLIFYPDRVNLSWSTTDPLAGFLALPLSLTVGPAAAYNLSLILQLVLSAFFARLLCLRISANEKAAFIGGIVFGFSPFLTAHALGHLSLVTAFPIPLFALLLDKIFTERDASGKRGILLGVALLLASLAHYNYVVLCLLLAFFWLAFDLLYDFPSRRFRIVHQVSKSLAVAAGTFALGFAPLLSMMMADRSQVPPPRGLGHIEQFSADALGFLIPSWNHILLGDLAKRMRPAIFVAGFEGTVYIGMLPFLLAAIGFWVGRRTRLGWARRAAILGGVFYLLSLGPEVRVLGHPLGLRGPAALLYGLPFARFLSAPARFDAVVTLCLAILCALGMKWILKEARSRQLAMVSAATALLICDYLTVPFPRSSISDPGAPFPANDTRGQSATCNLPGDLRHGTLLTFPLVKAPYSLRSMWMQVSDGGRYALLDGYLSYTPDSIWNDRWNIRVIRSLMSLEGLEQAPIDIAADRQALPSDIRRLNLAGVVIFDSPEGSPAVSYIQTVLRTRPESRGTCRVFPVQPQQSEGGPISLERRPADRGRLPTSSDSPAAAEAAGLRR